jgi:DNA polymerase-4
MLRRCWRGEGVFQVHVVALDPASVTGQIDLFAEEHAQARRRNQALDLINERFGEFTIAPAKLLRRSDMPNVIAPAWKPYGHRQTIPSTRPRRPPASGKLPEMDW